MNDPLPPAPPLEDIGYAATPRPRVDLPGVRSWLRSRGNRLQALAIIRDFTELDLRRARLQDEEVAARVRQHAQSAERALLALTWALRDVGAQGGGR